MGSRCLRGESLLIAAGQVATGPLSGIPVVGGKDIDSFYICSAALLKPGSGNQLVEQAAMPKGKTDKTKGASAKSKAATATTPANTISPSWPVFKPPLPLTDLTLESLVPDKVVLIRNFWPKSLCRDYVSFLRNLPLITTPSRPKRGEAARVNDRFQVEDPRFALRLWLETGLKNALLDDEFRQSWYVYSLSGGETSIPP